MPQDQLDALVAEQTAYYRARAGEYDKTSAYDVVSRAALVAALEAFAPYGRVLELACGTGEWTVELVKNASQLTAVDVAPEMLAVARTTAAIRGLLVACRRLPERPRACVPHRRPSGRGRARTADHGRRGSRCRAAPDDRRAIPNREGVLRARHAQSSAGRAWLGCRYPNGWLAVLLGRCKPQRRSPEQLRHSRSAQGRGAWEAGVRTVAGVRSTTLRARSGRRAAAGADVVHACLALAQASVS